MTNKTPRDRNSNTDKPKKTGNIDTNNVRVHPKAQEAAEKADEIVVSKAYFDGLVEKIGLWEKRVNHAVEVQKRLLGEKQAIEQQLQDADREAGEARRKLHKMEKIDQVRNQWIGNARAEAGFSGEVPFEKVWATVLAAYKEKLAQAEAAKSDADSSSKGVH